MTKFDNVLFISLLVLALLCGGATMKALADFNKLDKVSIVQSLRSMH